MTGLRLAFRTLFRTPFLTTVAVLSLALGIGANAAIFSLFDQFLLRSIPVQAPDELVNLGAPGPKPGSQSCGSAGDCDDVFSYAMFRDLEAGETGFSGIAGHRDFGANLAFEGNTVNGSGLLVSGSYFPVLGLQPALGRLLGPEDDRNIGEHYVTVLSHEYWQNDLGRDPGVLNRTLIVNGQPLTVVGVAPAGFEGTTLGSEPDIYVPLTMRSVMQPLFDGFENRRAYWVYVLGRLAPGVTLEQADATLNTLYAGIVNEVEAPLQDGMSAATMERFRTKRATLEPGNRGQSNMQGEADTPLKLLLSITALVLLIACANVANLLMARGVRRAPEMAIRGSLGARRRQLLGQLLAEAVVLALIGGAASLLVAYWTLRAMGAMMPPEATGMLALSLEPRIFLFTTVVALGTGILFGLYPALHATRTDLASIVKADNGQTGGSRRAVRFRGVLVTGQIALSMTLLVVAGLFLKSLVNVSRVELGIEEEGLLTFAVSPELNGYEPVRSAELFRRVSEELSAVPGVTAVSSSMVPILSGSSWGTDVRVEGWESGPDIDSNSRFNAVGPTYFSALGMPLLAGREFTEIDGPGAPQVAVVNEAFTRKFNLDGARAVGRWMSTGGGEGDELDIQIVGVVQDAKYNDVKSEVPPLFFLPARQDTTLGGLNFYVRTAGDAGPVLSAIPDLVRSLDPNLPVEGLQRLETQIKENVFVDRLITTFASAFAVLATLLAAVGLYGVLAYTVAQRTREIGLRMALGAGSRSVRSMVLGQVTRMAVIGGVGGGIAALFLGRTAGSLLYGIAGHDPYVVLLAAVVLAVVAMGAGYIPARRAARVDPMVALRYE
ncbi:MAG TPA: ABC transporter permease [Longimicrobiales bacterium]|nr:ABC transporter permease [Longimicrobiales bacterium]